MKIEQVRVRRLRGRMAVVGEYWEERFVRPIDVYPAYRRDPSWGREPQEGGSLKVEHWFVEIVADDGVRGLSGPHRPPVARIVADQLRPILIGNDPRASEYLWDVMHRLLVHGRQGEAMHAISAVDLALWDLKGKWLGQPVWRLLGGPTQPAIPAYASMLGYDTLDMGRVKERALAYKEQGYRAQKWFFRHGPMSGPEGLERNVALVRTLRETLGDGYDIMLDCWQSFDYRYVLDLAARIEDYRPYWIEEVVMPDRIDSYRRIKDKIRIPLSGAEHHYTRWGMQQFIEKGALDVYQADPIWCGGLSELVKIGVLTSTHDLICIPHGASTFANIQFSALQSPIMTPYQEYLVKVNESYQLFFETTLKPANGVIGVPDLPGVFPNLDPERIESEDEI